MRMVRCMAHTQGRPYKASRSNRSLPEAIAGLRQRPFAMSTEKEREYARNYAAKRRADPEKYQKMKQSAQAWRDRNRRENTSVEKEKFNAYHAEWRKKNAIRLNAYQAEQRIKNRERISKENIKWRKANPEKVAANNHRWKKENRPRVNELQRHRYRTNPEVREKSVTAAKRYAKENPEWAKQNHRKAALRKYGLTPEQWQLMFKEQGECCASCKSGEPSGRGKTFHVDHCHKTKKVRGILCHHCNLMLGNAKDDIARLEAAITYLKEANS